MPDRVLPSDPEYEYGGPEHRKWPQEQTASESHRTPNMRHIARPLGAHQIGTSVLGYVPYHPTLKGRFDALAIAITFVSGRAPYTKKAEARFKISFARRSSRFSCSKRFIFSRSAVEIPAASPESMSTFFTHRGTNSTP